MLPSTANITLYCLFLLSTIYTLTGWLVSYFEALCSPLDGLGTHETFRNLEYDKKTGRQLSIGVLVSWRIC